MRPRVSRWFNESATVERGPLVFSLEVPGEWSKLKDRGPASDWEVNPKGPWNYSVEPGGADMEGCSVRVEERPVGKSVFTSAGAPVRLRITAHRLEDWKEVNGSAAPPPQSPVASGTPAESLALVPYGAAKLRVTAFPVEKI